MSDDLSHDGENAAEIPPDASDISNQIDSDTLDSPPELSEDTHGKTGENLAGEGGAEVNEDVPEDVSEGTSVDTPGENFSAVPEDVSDASHHASEGGSPSENQDSIPEDSPADSPVASAETTSGGTDEDVSEDGLAERSDGYFTEQLEERTAGDSVDQSASDASEHQAATRADGDSGDAVESPSEVQEDAHLQYPSGPSDQTATSQNGQAHPAGLETDDATGRYEEVYSGHDVPGESDYFSDSQRAMETLPDFKPENWERLSLDDRKESIERLADYNDEILGIEHKPSIDYYAGDAPGEYGAFSGARNSLAINERNLDDGPETADTVSHEFRHAYQYQHAQNPVSERDLLFSENFDNYVCPEQDYSGYRDQILESDARDYAQRFRDRINS